MALRSIFTVLALGLFASFIFERINLLKTFYQNAPTRLTKINNIGAHQVKFSERIRSCEDVLLIEQHHLAILACDGGRERYNTVMGIFAGNVTENAKLWVYYYETEGEESLKPISLTGFPNANDFHSLGLAFDQQTSNLFVTNHAQAGPRIEMFSLDLDSLAARYIQTIEHPLIHGPNSIAIINSREFYVSNDHFVTKRQSVLVSNLETYLGTPTGTIVHVSLKESKVQAKIVARVPFANGIEILNTSVVAVASSSRAAVYLFDTPDPMTLKYNSKILLPFLPDNLSGYGNKLMVAGHAHMPSLVKFTQSRRFCNDPVEYERANSKTKEYCEIAEATSWAAEWSESEGLKNLYVDTEYPSSSTAVKGGGVGIITGLYAKGILVWRDVNPNPMV